MVGEAELADPQLEGALDVRARLALGVAAQLRVDVVVDEHGGTLPW
jgi:hypothetical protein